VSAAITSSALTLPHRRVTVSVTPPGSWTLPACTDLAVGAAVLAAAAVLPGPVLRGAVVLGALGLDGAVRPVPGVLGMVASAAELGHRTVVVPAGNAAEATLVPGMQVIAINRLQDLVTWAVTGLQPPLPQSTDRSAADSPALSDLVHPPASVDEVRFALEVAAAGGHHLAVIGPATAPTLAVAQYLPALLPDLDEPTALRVTALHAAAGYPVGRLIRRPLPQMPHPTSPIASVIGGDEPGSVTFAHGGVLIFEDAPAFEPGILQALCWPLERGTVQLDRAEGPVTYPAAFQLVLTAEPEAPVDGADAGPAVVRGLHGRLAPLAEHIGIVLALDGSAPLDSLFGEPSASAGRVAAARAAARQRWDGGDSLVNAAVSPGRLHNGRFRLPARATDGVARLLYTGALDITAYLQVLRLAWTVGDLRGITSPDRETVTTAADLYVGQRRGWAA
jgi:magnesium chelatase family protein